MLKKEFPVPDSITNDSYYVYECSCGHYEPCNPEEPENKMCVVCIER